MSDFRFLYRGDFEPAWLEEKAEHFRFVLKAIKPSRWAPPGERVAD